MEGFERHLDEDEINVHEWKEIRYKRILLLGYHDNYVHIDIHSLAPGQPRLAKGPKVMFWRGKRRAVAIIRQASPNHFRGNSK